MTARDPQVDAAVRAAAVRAAEGGWAVFPTRPDGKEPRAGLRWPKAAEAIKRNPALASQCHWRPGENYGVAAKSSGLVIIDLDQPKPGYEFPPGWRDVPGVADGADVLAVLADQAGAEWPHTFTVATPSGGRHLYYLAPVGRPIGNRPLGPKIDVRGGGNGDGGYVLGPGSVLGGRVYEVTDDRVPEPLPEWIADLLDPPRSIPPPMAPEHLEHPGDRVASRLDGLIATVLGARPGERNNVLHWAACRAAEMVAAGQLGADEVHACLGEAAARTGLNDGEAYRTIRSALSQSLRRSA
jgi:hypothetical protein